MTQRNGSISIEPENLDMFHHAEMRKLLSCIRMRVRTAVLSYGCRLSCYIPAWQSGDVQPPDQPHLDLRHPMHGIQYSCKCDVM